MYENEILVLIFSTFVMAVGLFYTKMFRSLAYFPILQASFIALWCAWLATNLEHFFYPSIFNALEHFGYLINSLLFFSWCVLMATRQESRIRD